MSRCLWMFSMLLGGLVISQAAEPKRFIQDRFAIGLWVDPPPVEKYYADLAAANFSVVIGGFCAVTTDAIRQQLELCKKYALRAVIARAGQPAGQLPKSPEVWGYQLQDEPGAANFPALRIAVDELRRARPGALAYINLFPNQANPKQLGTKSYDEYVRRFVEEVDPEVLSMDHYPYFRPDLDGRAGYCASLDVMRKYALLKNIPFWNFFNSMPFGAHVDPTEAQLRWQIYTSLAYGAKGVLYFCYWTPRGAEFPKGGGIISAEGIKTRHYEQARRLNRVIKNLGPVLMKLTSTSVVHGDDSADSKTLLKGGALKSLSKGDWLIGFFKHADGRRAVLLNNYQHAYTAWPTVEFASSLAQVREVDRETGAEIPVPDDSPDMKGLQISLDAGEGRLFLLPAH